MGLRVGLTQGVLSALRGINLSTTQQARALERIATGLKINRASDNPAGLVISEILRAQIGSTAQAIENVEFTSNLVTTAEGGLSEISDLLTRGRALAIQSLNTGVMSPEQRQALQTSMDQIIQAVNRIAGTTRFGDLDLLNGAQAIRTGNVAPELEQIRIFSVSAEVENPTINVQVLAPAAEAQTTGTIAAVQSGASTIRIRGELGAVEINITAGATRAEVAQAINQFTEITGVQANEITGEITSTNVGSAAFVEITELQGDLEGITAGYTTGTDIQGTINGFTAQGNRNVLSVSSDFINAEITVAQNAAAGNYTFQITGGGMIFQLGTENTAADRIRVGIESAASGNLGLPGGNVLSSLITGGANSLLSNPQGAINILDRAINQISAQRSTLGAFQSRLLETNRNALEVAFENLVASESSIRDGDIAEEVANSLRTRIVGEAGMMALRKANIFQSAILRLLT